MRMAMMGRSGSKSITEVTVTEVTALTAHWTHCATPRARGPDVKVDTRIRHHVRQVKEVKRK